MRSVPALELGRHRVRVRLASLASRLASRAPRRPRWRTYSDRGPSCYGLTNCGITNSRSSPAASASGPRRCASPPCRPVSWPRSTSGGWPEPRRPLLERVPESEKGHFGEETLYTPSSRVEASRPEAPVRRSWTYSSRVADASTSGPIGSARIPWARSARRPRPPAPSCPSDARHAAPAPRPPTQVSSTSPSPGSPRKRHPSRTRLGTRPSTAGSACPLARRPRPQSSRVKWIPHQRLFATRH